MLKAHEILGTDLPIYKEKVVHHFYLDEITHLNENPDNYRIAGYVRIIKNKEPFFKAVYIKKDPKKPLYYKQQVEKLIIPSHESNYKI